MLLRVYFTFSSDELSPKRQPPAVCGDVPQYHLSWPLKWSD